MQAETNLTISVVMAVFNGEKYLCEAIDSILGQTFEDFEFLIIDDGSTDATPAILGRYQRRDRRIILQTNAQNIGLTKSLNLGLQMARGRFVARMDADDISYPHRFARQLDFLSRHPDIDIVGSWVRVLRGNESSEVWKPPSAHSDIVARLCFHSVLYHPTALIRRRSKKQLPLTYDTKRKVAQDYDLWTRLALDYGAKLANVPEVLLVRRVHDDAIGGRAGELQQAVAADVRLAHLERLGIRPSAEELELHNAISIWRLDGGRDTLRQCAAWLTRLRHANDAIGLYPRTAFHAALEALWFEVCRRAVASEGLIVWFYYLCCQVTPPRPRRLLWPLKWCTRKVRRKRIG